MKLQKIGLFKVLFIFFTLLLVFSNKDVSALSYKHSIIITVDGLKADSLSTANLKNLNRLLQYGSYTLHASTVIPPITLQAHTALVTGLDPRKYGIELGFWKLNFWTPILGYTDKETIFSTAKKQNLKTAMFVGKSKLKYVAPKGTVDYFKVGSDSKEIASLFCLYMEREKPNLTLIHFPEPDKTGHREGWESKDYLKALEVVDASIGLILSEIEEIGLLKDTLIVVTSDHGGLHKSHAEPHPKVVEIPWIAFGSRIKRGYRIEKEVFIYDTAPTVLFALGITPPPHWDGKPIKEIFE